MKNCDFTLEHYRYILRKAKENFTIIGFSKAIEKRYESSERVMLVRHDVDHSLVNAYRIAKVEMEQSVFGTYFIRIHGEYNVFSAKSTYLIHKIIEYGHEIGFHYEFLNDASINETYDRINQEISLMERHFGIEISCGCSHQPMRNVKNFYQFRLDNLDFDYNAQDSRLYRFFKYISDSNYLWREGCLCKLIDRGENVYFNTHPLFWNDSVNINMTLPWNRLILENWFNLKNLKEIASENDHWELFERTMDPMDMMKSTKRSIDDLWSLLARKRELDETGKENLKRRVDLPSNRNIVINNLIEMEKIWEHINQVKKHRKV